MRRRDFVAALGGSAIVWAAEYVSAHGADDRARRIGILSGMPLITLPSFEEGLRELGWKLGRDIEIKYVSADGHLDRLPALAAELSKLKPDIILALSGPETKAANAVAGGDIPIVFAVHGDPVAAGDVRSLANPGGMITGLSQMQPELSRKQLEVLKECVPDISRIAVLWNSTVALKLKDWSELNLAAQALRLHLESKGLQGPADLDSIVAQLRADRPDAILVLGDPLTVSLRAAIADFALEQRLPAVYPFRVFVDSGGLISYGADSDDLFRRAAGYVDKILKGAKPSDLPIEQPIKFELVINLKTAKTLGIIIPPTLLARAEVVE
ncbi:ABC transporter substrate-binding protein [Bradyrhizobium tropiciagri]|uniref:ABC transporter substrate-binding protein n=1 Tax=Bradyrhizobium tropiciagri TaxID=312253 RepID=UPI00067BBDD4|nr:ABC transporter substrate-binding protein [Bradyrhizobium tropiciagri]